MKPVLPIDISSGLKLDYKLARGIGEELAGSYCFAEPFPHIVLDNFLPEDVARVALDNFPSGQLESDRRFDMGYAGYHKRQILPEDCNAAAREVFRFFNSQPMLEFLEGLSAIQGLISDPYYVGGGYHEIGRGGKLGIHADFRINDRLHVERRMNVIIYLNEDWRDEWGGFLELWDRGMRAKVIFNTDADSYHGHPDPLAVPEGVLRKSIALYYYTASRDIYKQVPNKGTIYQARPSDTKETKREAFILRMDQHLKQWVPPSLLRYAYAIRRRVMPDRSGVA